MMFCFQSKFSLVKTVYVFKSRPSQSRYVIGHFKDQSMQARKNTAWKKNRKFGDVSGGRDKIKLADNIFNREHNLSAPNEKERKPIFIIDNPSRDFYFPVTKDEVRETLQRLPENHTNHLTHIWLQRIKKSDYLSHKTFQGSFVCGGGVYLIILHPFQVDNKMRFGKSKPLKKTLNYYRDFTMELKMDQDGWFLQWTHEKIREYYLEILLLHEIGHSIDSFYKRYWSKSTKQKREKWADNYATVWADQLRETYESIEKNAL